MQPVGSLCVSSKLLEAKFAHLFNKMDVVQSKLVHGNKDMCELTKDV